MSSHQACNQPNNILWENIIKAMNIQKQIGHIKYQDASTLNCSFFIISIFEIRTQRARFKFHRFKILLFFSNALGPCHYGRKLSVGRLSSNKKLVTNV